ncbi:hypothetical protein [Pseudomonas putida]|uniref:Uncharacterized protein n=1 Tax=Pseudomonas putida TaxID=303 RepID=A0A1Y3LJG1_PSEPU|nr:hypothetical protein [Pseudomonas putida]OUM38096.1 hypothetical protein B8W72_02855 [Pseudomonas putida]
MVMLLLSCAMQGILGATFYPTKPTFSCALSRKKLSPQNSPKNTPKPLESTLQTRQFKAFAILSASTS